LIDSLVIIIILCIMKWIHLIFKSDRNIPIFYLFWEFFVKMASLKSSRINNLQELNWTKSIIILSSSGRGRKAHLAMIILEEKIERLSGLLFRISIFFFVCISLGCWISRFKEEFGLTELLRLKINIYNLPFSRFPIDLAGVFPWFSVINHVCTDLDNSTIK